MGLKVFTAARNFLSRAKLTIISSYTIDHRDNMLLTSSIYTSASQNCLNIFKILENMKLNPKLTLKTAKYVK